MQVLAALYYQTHYKLFNSLRHLDGLPALALRLYLVPIFWMAGNQKLNNIDSTAEWFGNSEWGLGLPAPEFLAYLATYTEVIGAVLLLSGLAVRWIAVPLMVTMIVAAISVHWDNGWAAIADSSSDEISSRLNAAKSVLQENANYRWITEKGNLVILNNGIEFSITYFIMLLALFFSGGGRYFSVDYWLDKSFRNTN
jgi:putative oxidoreductase